MNTRQTEPVPYRPQHEADDRTIILGESHEIKPRGRHSLGARVLELAAQANDPELLKTARELDVALETNRPRAEEDADAFIEAVHSHPDVARPLNAHGFAGTQDTEVMRFPKPPAPANLGDAQTAHIPRIDPRADQRFIPRPRQEW